MKCLGTMWLKGPKGGDHQERLESFYAPQAEADDRVRSAFLWGRKPMLAASATWCGWTSGAARPRTCR